MLSCWMTTLLQLSAELKKVGDFHDCCHVCWFSVVKIKINITYLHFAESLFLLNLVSVIIFG